MIEDLILAVLGGLVFSQLLVYYRLGRMETKLKFWINGKFKRR